MSERRCTDPTEHPPHTLDPDESFDYCPGVDHVTRPFLPPLCPSPK